LTLLPFAAKRLFGADDATGRIARLATTIVSKHPQDVNSRLVKEAFQIGDHGYSPGCPLHDQETTDD